MLYIMLIYTPIHFYKKSAIEIGVDIEQHKWRQSPKVFILVICEDRLTLTKLTSETTRVEAFGSVKQT